jgi:hypothetical protein
MLASVYVAIFAPLNSDLSLLKRLPRVLVGSAIFYAVLMVVPAIAAVTALRSQGLDAKSIATKILQQPRWWRWWYPRPLRRRGDVWDRLPRELRRYRIYWGICLIYTFGIYLPLVLLSVFFRRQGTVTVLLVSLFAAGAMMFAARRRAATYIRTRLGATPATVSAILNTPTCRGSFWRRPSTVPLLGQAQTRRVGREPNPVFTRKLADRIDSDGPTQA